MLICADGPEENSSKLLSTPFVEDPQQRLKWTAYLEFTHNDEVGDLTWDKVCLDSHLFSSMYVKRTISVSESENCYCAALQKLR